LSITWSIEVTGTLNITLAIGAKVMTAGIAYISGAEG